GWGPIGLLQRVEKLVLSPFHFNYHHEHHLRAGVPYPALPTVHRALVDAGYYLRNPDNLRRSYLATIVETLRRADEIPDLP
ncbi:MAG: fatty acid desaturase, partial [Deltaproteobacteria bacterium]|nr:fatty acid desaturase [Deltaproteobacteria bacterium]